MGVCGSWLGCVKNAACRVISAGMTVYGLIDAGRRVRARALARHHSLIDGWLPGRPTGTLCDLVWAFTEFGWPWGVPGGEEYQVLNWNICVPGLHCNTRASAAHGRQGGFGRGTDSCRKNPVT